MTDKQAYIKAYYRFKGSVDYTKCGILPELDNLVTLMVMGIPAVPADEDHAEDSQIIAMDQRLYILKAVFVEVNQGQSEDFLDRGLSRYDQACRIAKRLLEDAGSEID